MVIYWWRLCLFVVYCCVVCLVPNGPRRSSFRLGISSESINKLAASLSDLRVSLIPKSNDLSSEIIFLQLILNKTAGQGLKYNPKN